MLGMTSESPVCAKKLYQLYFYWFNIAHEMAHILKLRYGTSRYVLGDFRQEEQECNDFAAAYWQHSRQESRLQTLSKLISEALSHLPDPAPADARPQAFFNENCAELSKRPAEYGHLQFAFVKKALEEKMDLLTAMRRSIHPNATPADRHLHFDYEEINAALPPSVVDDLRRVVAAFGVTLPSIDVIKESYPMPQSVVPEEERDEWPEMAADMRSS
jgi:hypothetical protein